MNQTTNQPIASISYEWTEEYYNRLIHTQYNPVNTLLARWFIIAFYGLSALFWFFIGDEFSIIFGLFLSICAIFLTMIRYYGYSVYAIYKSLKIYHGLTVSFEFYDKYFVVSDKFGTNTLPYDILYSVQSSKFGYVLCTSKISGYFIPKEECSDTLIQFINNLKND